LNDQPLQGSTRKTHYFCFYSGISGKIAMPFFCNVVPLFDVAFPIK
jgi:hypothetical protein